MSSHSTTSPSQPMSKCSSTISNASLRSVNSMRSQNARAFEEWCAKYNAGTQELFSTCVVGKLEHVLSAQVGSDPEAPTQKDSSRSSKQEAIDELLTMLNGLYVAAASAGTRHPVTHTVMVELPVPMPRMPSLHDDVAQGLEANDSNLKLKSAASSSLASPYQPPVPKPTVSPRARLSPAINSPPQFPATSRTPAEEHLSSRVPLGNYTFGEQVARRPTSASDSNCSESGFAGGPLSALARSARFSVQTDADGYEMLNDYTILDEIGRGASGTVMLAISASTDQPYAIKGVPRSVRGSDIEQEIAIMKQLRHPNVIRLHEVIEDEADCMMYLIMDYIPNGPVVKLSTDAMACTPLEPAKLQDFAQQITSGLLYLHKRRIVHRDIKPDNMLVDDDGKLVITDFGVSLFAAQANAKNTEPLKKLKSSLLQNTALTHAGTAMFLAPELLNSVDSAGPPADVWAFGVSLYAMMFGKLPFLAPSLRELMGRITDDEVQFPEDAPPVWCDAIRRLLDKDPRTRITMKQFSRHQLLKLKIEDHYKQQSFDEEEEHVALDNNAALGLSLDATSPELAADPPIDDLSSPIKRRNDMRFAFFSKHKVENIMSRRVSLGFHHALAPLDSPTNAAAASVARRGTLKHELEAPDVHSSLQSSGL